MQAEAVLEYLERCGYRIVKVDEDRGVKPANIGDDRRADATAKPNNLIT